MRYVMDNSFLAGCGLEKLKEITLMVKTSSEEMEQRSGEIIDIGRNLEKVTVEIGNGMNDMAKRTEEVNETMNQVNSISGKSSGNIEILKEAISHFTIREQDSKPGSFIEEKKIRGNNL